MLSKGNLWIMLLLLSYCSLLEYMTYTGKYTKLACLSSIVFNVCNQFDILRVFLRAVSLHHEYSPTMMLLSLLYKKSESSKNSDEQLE